MFPNFHNVIHRWGRLSVTAKENEDSITTDWQGRGWGSTRKVYPWRGANTRRADCKHVPGTNLEWTRKGKCNRDCSNVRVSTTCSSYTFLCARATCCIFPSYVRSLKSPFTQAIFVAATRCNFCRAKIASSFKHIRNPCDIAATNRTENRTWFTRAILKLHL